MSSRKRIKKWKPRPSLVSIQNKKRKISKEEKKDEQQIEEKDQQVEPFNNNNQNSSLLIPHDTLVEIFQTLDLKSVLQCMLVNKRYYAAAKSDSLWIKFLREKYPHSMYFNPLYKFATKVLQEYGYRGAFMNENSYDFNLKASNYVLKQYKLPPKWKTEGTMNFIITNASQTVLCVGFDNEMRLWNIESTKFIGELTGHSGEVVKAVFDPFNEDHIFSCSLDNTIRQWSVSEKKCIHLINVMEPEFVLTSIDVSKDFIACSFGGGIYVWNKLTRKIWRRKYMYCCDAKFLDNNRLLLYCDRYIFMLKVDDPEDSPRTFAATNRNFTTSFLVEYERRALFYTSNIVIYDAIKDDFIAKTKPRYDVWVSLGFGTRWFDWNEYDKKLSFVNANEEFDERQERRTFCMNTLDEKLSIGESICIAIFGTKLFFGFEDGCVNCTDIAATSLLKEPYYGKRTTNVARRKSTRSITNNNY